MMCFERQVEGKTWAEFLVVKGADQSGKLRLGQASVGDGGGAGVGR